MTNCKVATRPQNLTGLPPALRGSCRCLVATDWRIYTADYVNPPGRLSSPALEEEEVRLGCHKEWANPSFDRRGGCCASKSGGFTSVSKRRDFFPKSFINIIINKEQNRKSIHFYSSLILIVYWSVYRISTTTG